MFLFFVLWSLFCRLYAIHLCIKHVLDTYYCYYYYHSTNHRHETCNSVLLLTFGSLKCYCCLEHQKPNLKRKNENKCTAIEMVKSEKPAEQWIFKSGKTHFRNSKCFCNWLGNWTNYMYRNRQKGNMNSECRVFVDHVPRQMSFDSFYSLKIESICKNSPRYWILCTYT